MTDNIYDIIGKLNGLGSKSNPVSTSAESVYENVDPKDITASVNSMMDKYENFLVEEKAKKSQDQKDDDIARGEPEVVKLLNKARLERPTAASDMEAFAYQMVKANKELEKAQAANDEQEKKIADLDAKVVALSTAKPAPVQAPTPAPAVIAQPTAAAPTTAPAARPSATILRMPTPTTAEVPAQAPATAEVPGQTKPAKTYKPAKGKKSAVGGKVTPTLDQPTPDELAGAQKQVRAPNVVDFPTLQKTPLKTAVGQQFNNENKSMKDMLKESIKLVQEYREGDPDMGLLNYNTLLEKFKTGVQKISLNFGPGKDLTLYDYQAYGLLSELGSDQNEERKVARIEGIMSSYDAVVNLLQTPKVKRYIGLFPQFEKTSPIFKQRAREIEKGKFQLGSPDPKKGFTDPNYNPKTDPASPEYDPTYPVQPHPYQQSDSQLEENVGNNTMQENIKTNSILEGVRQVEIKKLKEAAKPDFLDLDKDGDTDEPMKSAAKSTKDDEPAKPDSDAVAKRKRLQALKDRQEDERAEKNDYDTKSSSRKIKGRAYGGSAQKDDEEKDELEEGKMKEIYTDMMDLATKKGYSNHKQFTPADYDELGKKHNISGKDLAVALGHKKTSEVVESGLQYYTGKKKYGKEGMTALSKAGREGASEEELGRIKDKYKKEGIELDEKAVSKQQQKFMGMVHAVQKGKMKAPSKLISKTAKDMSKSDARDFAATKHKGLPTKVTEGKEAIRNHPIYTNEQAWKHYSEELAEQEAMDQSMMEAPVVDVQEELNEIARLAGLTPKMENLDPMVPGDSVSPLTHTEEGMGCSMEELKEAMTRKHYREMADKIKNMADREDAGKICRTFADMAKADNPRFKEDMFYAACGVKPDHSMSSEASTVLVGEEETMDEGNEFTKARLDAIAAGKDTFTVGGKTYKVSGDTSAEKTQVESIDDEKQEVTEDINLNVTANGEEDVVNLIRKLSGMPMIAVQMPQAEEHCDTCGGMPCACEESVEEQRDIEHANTPHETVAPITAVTTDAGGGLGGVKKQYPLAANRGANPIEENLWTAYETMIKDLKA